MDSREDSVKENHTHTHTHTRHKIHLPQTHHLLITPWRGREREREKRVGGERADISLVKRKRTFPYEYNLILSCFRAVTNLWM